MSLNKLGDFLAQRAQPGDADQALAHYQRSLELAEKLRADNPASAQAARDVSVSLNQLGDFLILRAQPGDADQALAHYQRGNDLLERLRADNPASAQAARDVSLSLERLGGFLARRAQPGDSDQALAHYQRSLELADKLRADNPASAQAARDVSLSLERLGDFLAQRAQPGDADQTLAHYQRSLELREKLLADNPASAEAARDVVVSHYKLAAFCSRQGDAAGGQRHRRACYDLLHARIPRGMTFDPPIVRLYEALKAEFGGK